MSKSDPHSQNPYEVPIADRTSAPRSPTSRSFKVKNVDVLSVAITFAVLYAAIALVVGVVFFLISLVGAGLSNSGAGAIAGVGTGVIMLFLLPILYGFGGFIGGLLVAALYNLAANFTGGIKITLE
jgi:hypothetical protein